MAIELTEEQKTLRAKRRFLDVWSIVGGLILTAAVVFLLSIMPLPVSIALWTIVIVFCLRNLVNKLEEKGLNRLVGTTIAYVAMVVVLALLGLLLFSPMFGLGDQFVSLLEALPGYVQQTISWANDIYARYADVFANDTVRQWISDMQNALLGWASSLAPATATGVMAIGTAIMNGLMGIGFALVIAFWLLMELPAIGREADRLIGEKHRDDFRMIHLTVSRVMGGYIKGTLLQCAVIAVACAVLFGILGIPNYMALGGIAGLMNIVPVIGPWLGGVLAAVVGVFVSPVVGVVALLGTIAIQQAVYTFVSPKIMQNSVDIHPALMLFALMCGSALGTAMSGVMGSLVGMLVAIPIVAMGKSVFVYYFEKKTGRKLVSPDGVFFKASSGDDEEVDPVADATSPHPDASASFAEIRERRMPKLKNRRRLEAPEEARRRALPLKGRGASAENGPSKNQSGKDAKGASSHDEDKDAGSAREKTEEEK